MEEDTDDEGLEEEEDEYAPFGSLNSIYGINICMIFFLFIIPNMLYFAVRVQMSIQMMRMSAGKFAEQLLNA